MAEPSTSYRPTHKLRFVTAAALFDGHDAAINVIRRMLQAAAVEVIHLGHNRSAQEIVEAAIEEDVQGIAISSYQGGHVEFFRYVVDLLTERGAGHVKVFGGGGGTIAPREVRELESYGVERLYSPEDGRRMGLEGIIGDMVERADFATVPVDHIRDRLLTAPPEDEGQLARLISVTELDGQRPADLVRDFRGRLNEWTASSGAFVMGVTGTGGAGKSSLVDEVLGRYRRDFPDDRVVVLCVDPTKRATGGALLGDRIRMNSVHGGPIFMRSLATRGSSSEVADGLDEAVLAAKASGARLIIVETSGIGQGDAAIVDRVDCSVYVMTPEYGAASQLEKIDMIDLADVVVVNKFDRATGEDALRDVRKQYRRAHKLFEEPADDGLPIFGTISSQYHDEGVNALYRHLLDRIDTVRDAQTESKTARPERCYSLPRNRVIPPHRSHYLGEIADGIRSRRQWIADQADRADEAAGCDAAKAALGRREAPDAGLVARLDELSREAWNRVDPSVRSALEAWDETVDRYGHDEVVTRVRDREIVNPRTVTSLSGLPIPRVSLPRFRGRGDIVRWLFNENLPGFYPFTAGGFAFKRQDEDPARMFAGEGAPARTNSRFHLLCEGAKAHRLSTAFDSVTLYGDDPAERPDIYGKIGESGVSVCTLRDMEILYGGFDLTDRNTSVSMTINGPAPIILAFFMNTAINQQIAGFKKEHGRLPNEDETAEIHAYVLKTVRGTVQADILKEDQAQNTCIFSTEFALRMMGDVQQYFIDHGVRNYYSVSISGYHIAEAGANPITQLAFTLANGFTYVEYYLARGMSIDDFAPNLSFFFSNGLDPEYSVLGRVARRIWAWTIRNKYGGNTRSQKLKYHIQTSGRSLHAQEMAFNDIRTTLQALMAINDNCNSLHTNAYDEAVTTPTEESVRRALAIQMVINREYGLTRNENSLQGSFVIEELTDLVEEAVLGEFDAIDRRGGVLGAMEVQYQRSKIQEESLLYERMKHSGELPIIGVNTFVRETEVEAELDEVPLSRAGNEEKQGQIAALREFQTKHGASTPDALAKLQDVAVGGGNIFAALMECVKVASLGQISQALYEVGGRYRRNM